MLPIATRSPGVRRAGACPGRRSDPDVGVQTTSEYVHAGLLRRRGDNQGALAGEELVEGPVGLLPGRRALTQRELDYFSYTANNYVTLKNQYL